MYFRVSFGISILLCCIYTDICGWWSCIITSHILINSCKNLLYLNITSHIQKWQDVLPLPHDVLTLSSIDLFNVFDIKNTWALKEVQLYYATVQTYLWSLLSSVMLYNIMWTNIKSAWVCITWVSFLIQPSTFKIEPTLGFFIKTFQVINWNQIIGWLNCNDSGNTGSSAVYTQLYIVPQTAEVIVSCAKMV